MIQRFSMALSQVKVGNKSVNLLNEIRHTIYSLYQAKEITKKVCNNIMNSMTVWYKMDTIFMICENNKNIKQWENVNMLCKNNKFKISTLMWNERF